MDNFVLIANIIKIFIGVCLIFPLYTSWKNKTKIGYTPLFLLCIFTITYIVLTLFINFSLFSAKYLELSIRPISIGIVLSSVYLILEYTGHKLNKKETLYIFISYLLLCTVLFITNYRDIMYTRFELGRDGYIIPVETDLLFLIYILPTSILVVSSIFIIYKYALSYKISRLQSIIIGIGLTIGYITISIDSVIYTFHQAINIDAIGIGIGVGMISFSLIYLNNANNISLNKTEILENINDTIISITSSNIISDVQCNKNTDIKITENDIGKNIETIFKEYNINIVDIINNDTEEILKITINKDTKYYTVKSQTVNRTVNILYNNKECFGHIIILKDITDKRKNEEQIKLLKNIFGRVLRHNIKNELNIIQGNASMIIENCPSNDDYIQPINNSVSDLLKISDKAQLAEQVIENMNQQSQFDSKQLIKMSKNHIKMNYENIMFKYKIDSSFKFMAHEQFEMIIKEIIDNGIQHNNSNKKCIKITSKINNGEKQIIISDNGFGIPEDEVKPIFKSTKETPLEHGSSLGLWLIKFVIDMSESSIEFEKTENGTKVIIKLH